jgi:peptide/nickel transport system substrate-binding protein
MSGQRKFAAHLARLLVILVTLGCGSSKPAGKSGDAGGQTSKPSDSGGSTASSGEEGAENAGPAKPFVLGDLIEPFTPPTLAELNAVDWVDSPVIDDMQRLRDAKAKEPPPLVSVSAALAMKNDSPEANSKILSALSVMAPTDGTGVNWEASFKRALLQDLRTINPVLYSSVAEAEIINLTSFGLFGFDWNMIPFALDSYVKSWQTSRDHMLDKVVMRDDITWSDGRPITAHDVAYSFKLIMSSAVPIPAVRTNTEEFKWIEAYDDHTLVYFHKQPKSTNIWHLNFPVLPKHVYEKSIAKDPSLRTNDYHRELERSPVTGGMYEVVRWTRGQEIVLRRREGYYMHNGNQVRAKPAFAEMRFRVIEDGNTRLLALKSGDIQETELEAAEWQTKASGDDFYRENTKVTGPGWLYMYIGWNLDGQKAPYFTDVRVRRAMACAMNYKEMLDDLSYGVYSQSLGMFHPDSWMYPKQATEPYRFDLNKAEELLDAAGWKDSDADGIRDKEINGRRVKFEFDLVVSNKADRIAICNLFRESLESIGVTCNISPLEAAVFQERVFTKNYQAQMSGWSPGADPYTTKNIFVTGQGRNSGSYSNPEVDGLYEEASKEFDREKQAVLYGRIHQLVNEDQPYLFLYNKNWLYGFNKQLRGYRFSPRGPFHYSPGIEALWMQ